MRAWRYRSGVGGGGVDRDEAVRPPVGDAGDDVVAQGGGRADDAPARVEVEDARRRRVGHARARIDRPSPRRAARPPRGEPRTASIPSSCRLTASHLDARRRRWS